MYCKFINHFDMSVASHPVSLKNSVVRHVILKVARGGKKKKVAKSKFMLLFPDSTLILIDRDLVLVLSARFLNSRYCTVLGFRGMTNESDKTFVYQLIIKIAVVDVANKSHDSLLFLCCPGSHEHPWPIIFCQ